tara:strand:- start:350 stop:613 length:264 start_codon:yes stop_codon:yes gene_type:complete
MLKNLLKMFFPSFFEDPERARDKKGRLMGDDASTPTINEAWVGGKAPVKPKAAPKKRGRPKGSKNKVKKTRYPKIVAKKKGRPKKNA